MEAQQSNPVAYMSEREVQTIISSFRSALTMYTNEVEKLQMKNEALHSDLQGEITKASGLQEELKNLQLVSQEKNTTLDAYQDKINLIEAGLSKISTTHATKSQEFNERFKKNFESETHTEKSSEDFMKTFYELVETIKYYEQQNILLRKSTEDLQDDLEKMNSGERICKMCLHCKREFIPKQNKEGDCVYHSGKLKYYSCKGCGDDAYYNCCNKCMKCSDGCRRGKHIPL